jgi:16S rRNA (guanine966-N2)-methyltransferase
VKRTPKKASPATHRLRIIGGEWRGRKLPILDAEGLRPTGDRLRETLFNWLTLDLPGARCLDVFAGTGALGLEALSRGAGSVTMIELQGDVAEQLRANCATLGARNVDIIQTNALTWLKQPHEQQFDVVFIDPPFAANLWQQSVDLLEQQALLADEAIIYVETPKDVHLEPPADWSLHRRKPAGAVCAYLYIKNSPQETSAL